VDITASVVLATIVSPPVAVVVMEVLKGHLFNV
jgi:hypothetical protein